MSANILTQTTTIDGIDADTLTVSRASRDDRGRTTWTVTIAGTDLITGESVETTGTYRTNSDGEGLWAGEQQILGTTQFRASRRAILAFVRRSCNIGDAA